MGTENGSQFNETFCVLPWVHLHVGPQGLNSLCCDADEYVFSFGKFNENDPLEGFKSNTMKDIRRSMLSGEKIRACERCYTNEKNEIRSARQFYNETIFPKEAKFYFEQKSVDSKGIISIDFRADSTCNFKCRTCNPIYSSAIAAEESQLGKTNQTREAVKISILKLLDQVDFTNIRRIYFAGGEPLLARDHYRFLDRLIQENYCDIELVYTTNFARILYNNYEILNIWSRFSKIVLGISLDSWGARAEYIRSGQNWEQTEIDIQMAKRLLPKAIIFPSCTVSALNLLTLPEFIENLVEKGLFTRADFHLHMVYSPIEFRVDNQGPEFARQAVLKLNSYIEFLEGINEQSLAQKIEGLRTFVLQYSDQDRSRELIANCQAKDQIRNTSLSSTFPELEFLFKSNKVKDIEEQPSDR